MAKISVVIPVYNVERYLRQCLDSVRGQTFTDLEIICVDDGSTDGSATILTEYALKDDRIRIISQANGGLSKARNVGMDAAKGDYIYFLDSDDWIASDALERAHGFAESNRLDQVIFSCKVIAEGEVEDDPVSMSRKQAYYRLPEDSDGLCLPGSEMLVTLSRERHCFVSVPLRLFRLDRLRENGVRFPTGVLHEDEYFTPIALIHAKRAGILRCDLYYRRIHAGTITTTDARPHVVRRLAGCMAVLVLLQSAAEGLQGVDRMAIELRLRSLFRGCMAIVRTNRGILSEAVSFACGLPGVSTKKIRTLSRRIRITRLKRRIRAWLGFGV